LPPRLLGTTSLMTCRNIRSFRPGDQSKAHYLVHARSSLNQRRKGQGWCMVGRREEYVLHVPADVPVKEFLQ
jgi:hypothetical protein